jgi:hypothetical protein
MQKLCHSSSSSGGGCGSSKADAGHRVLLVNACKHMAVQAVQGNSMRLALQAV